MIIEVFKYTGISRILALISLVLSVGAVVSEICILIKVGGIYASGLLFINGGLILAIWACWIAEFVIKKVKDKRNADLSAVELKDSKAM